MAQFTGRRSSGGAWLAVLLVILLVLAAVVVYLALAQPDLLASLQSQLQYTPR